MAYGIESAYTIVATPLTLPFLAGVLLSSATNGLIDSTTRTQLKPEKQILLFRHLSAISKDHSCKLPEIINTIVTRYKDRRMGLGPTQSSLSDF